MNKAAKQIVRQVVTDTAISQEVVEAIIRHQFNSAAVAIRHNKSVEISGFGKFIFYQKKGIAKLARIRKSIKDHEKVVNNPKTSTRKKQASEAKLVIIKKYEIELLEKLNEGNELEPII